jgi:hypothetical protein
MKLLEQIGPPDLKLGPLAIWVHGRQFEDSRDFGDGNWLRVTVHCGAQGAEVTISGTFIRVTELLAWANEFQALLDRTSRTAELPTLEPNLSVEMKLDDLGHVETNVEISPDHLTQQHTFVFELDQSYLPSLIAAINSIATRFPERGVPERVV